MKNKYKNYDKPKTKSVTLPSGFTLVLVVILLACSIAMFIQFGSLNKQTQSQVNASNYIDTAIAVQGEIQLLQMQVDLVWQELEVVSSVYDSNDAVMTERMATLREKVNELIGMINEKTEYIDSLFARFDMVVAYQGGLVGPTWDQGYYRLYRSGWVEQGGRSQEMSVITANVATTISITLPKRMANVEYVVQHSLYGVISGWASIEVTSGGRDFDRFNIVYFNRDPVTRGNRIMWEVRGMAA